MKTRSRSRKKQGRASIGAIFSKFLTFLAYTSQHHGLSKSLSKMDGKAVSKSSVKFLSKIQSKTRSKIQSKLQSKTQSKN